MLTKRLEQVLNLIEGVQTVADIGTDHAYLPISIIDKRKAKFVYAVDVNEKPLQSAMANIKKYGFSNNITPVLSNGLEFSLSDEVKEIDYVTISGLGTQTILSILENDNDKIKGYIICSNTDLWALRDWVKEKDYNIELEDFFDDYDKHYWLIKINKNKKFEQVSDDFMRLGDYKFLANNETYGRFLISEKAKFDNIISKITNDENRRSEMIKVSEIIGRYLENGINKNN
ncbi:tRNA (adenine(22)-N(1))-methyltransferase [[Acholeplasma] multilocale]|uniref:tRNA (adenine(22)-N(1))-methyltransferase n=1 Tax=[Acholeplasma] multilocale TaxID=264638 RepID=UPI00047AFBE8|nr:class I SAM-dependent methyltransferase [[Acholeplasma] multilocale]